MNKTVLVLVLAAVISLAGSAYSWRTHQQMVRLNDNIERLTRDQIARSYIDRQTCNPGGK
jgi:hypothetical protein